MLSRRGVSHGAIMNVRGMSREQVLAEFYGWRPESHLLRAVALSAPPRMSRGGRGKLPFITLRLSPWAADALDQECNLKQKHDLVVFIIRESRREQ